MARTWLSIPVDLVGGHGEQYRPRTQPGRIFAVARSHTFKQLADAIDDAFAQWDRSTCGSGLVTERRELRALVSGRGR